MDPLTHGVIGLAISAFSGETVTALNPISIGCAVGAMIPDIDVVVRLFKGEMVYLKHHRGMTHSVPFLLGLSSIITVVLAASFPTYSFFNILIWTFIGALSHTAFDILNSYGAMLFTKKRKASLLTLYDPLISIIALFLIFYPSHDVISYSGSVIVFTGYLIFRIIQKKKVFERVTDYFKDEYKITQVVILPSLKVFYKWDFVVATKTHSIVGKYNIYNDRFEIIETFKNTSNDMVEVFKSSNVGKYFEKFTPNYHIVIIENEESTTLKVIDLRYHFKNDFMHHASIEMDLDNNIMASFFHPYSIDKRIEVCEA